MNRRGFFGALAGGITAAFGAKPSFLRPSIATADGQVMTEILPGLFRSGAAFVPPAKTPFRTFIGATRVPVRPMAAVASPAPVQMAKGIGGELPDRLEGGVAHGGEVSGRRGCPSGGEVALGLPDDAVQQDGGLIFASREDAQQPRHEVLQGDDASGEQRDVLIHRDLLFEIGTTATPIQSNVELQPWPGHADIIAGTACLPPLLRFDRLVALFGASGEDAPAFAAALIGELVVTQLRLDDLRAIHAPGRASP